MKRVFKIKNNKKIEVIQFDTSEFQNIISITLVKLKNDLKSFWHIICFILITVYITYYSILYSEYLQGNGLYTFIFYESLFSLCYITYLDIYYWINSKIIYDRINFAVNEHLKNLDNAHEYITESGLVIQEVEVPIAFIECSVSLSAYIYYKYMRKLNCNYIRVIK